MYLKIVVFLICCLFSQSAYATCGMASFYGNENHQVRTATGERYNPMGLSAAHRTLPFGTRLWVTNQKNGRSVEVIINDRGPAKWTHRDIDLSIGAARAIGMTTGTPVCW